MLIPFRLFTAFSFSLSKPTSSLTAYKICFTLTLPEYLSPILARYSLVFSKDSGLFISSSFTSLRVKVQVLQIVIISSPSFSANARVLPLIKSFKFLSNPSMTPPPQQEASGIGIKFIPNLSAINFVALSSSLALSCATQPG